MPHIVQGIWLTAGCPFALSEPPMSALPEAPEDRLAALLQEAVRPLLNEALEPLRVAVAQPADGLLTFAQAAAWLAISSRTLESIVSDGELLPIVVRGQRRFTREQLSAYIHRCAGRKARTRR